MRKTPYPAAAEAALAKQQPKQHFKLNLKIQIREERNCF
jgi:hypothetical protein